jgi:enoyl-CoA hydratase/carnithine racemase
MERSSLKIERDHGVGWIRIDRPERLNAFAGTMREDLA